MLIKDRHPAYITWEQYESNQRRLQENDNRRRSQRTSARRFCVVGGNYLVCSLRSAVVAEVSEERTREVLVLSSSHRGPRGVVQQLDPLRDAR